MNATQKDGFEIVVRGFEHGINWYHLWRLVDMGDGELFVEQDVPARVHKFDNPELKNRVMEDRVLFKECNDREHVAVKGYGTFPIIR